jgi:ELWxxDGT repeat protein
MTSRAVFSGLDASDHFNLWVTDGTAAGTSELTPAGAYYYGLDASGFTALGTRILFEGVDASGGYKPWVTDGTSAGTSELPVGLFTPSSLAPDFTVIGSKALFAGAGAGNRGDLWVTDGTANGTSDLTAASQTALNPGDLTVFVTRLYSPELTRVGGIPMATLSSLYG